MTGQTFFAAALAAALGLVLVGLWYAMDMPGLGTAFVIVAFMIGIWAMGAHQKRMWAWRVAMGLCWLLFGVALGVITGAAAAYVINFEPRGGALLAVAGCTALVIMVCAYAFWSAYRGLKRQRRVFDAAHMLERTLGSDARYYW